ncbi:MAG: hypothetical protein ABFS45_08750 [Pseudomonadota bacterium]
MKRSGIREAIVDVSILLMAELSLPAAADCLHIISMAAAVAMGSIYFRIPPSSPYYL